MKKLFVAFAVVSFLLSATPAMAVGLTEAQIQAVVSLVSSFGADASVVKNVEASLRGQATSGTTSPSSTTCISLNNNLYVDSTDATTNGEVTKLQQFLNGRVTGYFGPATLQLVQDWQSAHGVVSSGSPDTSGFGYVGSKTRSAMRQGCNNSTNNQPAISAGTQSTTPTTPTAVSAGNGASLSISLGQVTVTTNSAYLSWSTNIPTNSKVFLNQVPATSNSPQVISSVPGYSTQGFVNITNLLPNTEYSYTIESINGTQDQKFIGLFTTNLPPPVTPVPAADAQITLNMYADLVQFAKSFVTNSTCPNSPVIVLQPQIIPSEATVSVVDDTIIWHSISKNVSVRTLLGVALYDPCVGTNQLTWSYSSPLVKVGSPTVMPAAGMAEATIAPGSTYGTVNIMATEPGGGTSTKTVTIQIEQ